ncbi:MAG: right-handed parallel beta-helix repeat-containing protein [Saprospiraceae bacterium]|nr:right-handed parallel beta-helix repeat-containing protein [Saprospiraceae bacterium]
MKDNIGGCGFYANGPINGVTLNNLDVSGHTAAFGAARGIVIWNGFKQNISITNCDVYNNNCCGIELSDGTASGVTMSNNNVHDNADNGFGLLGLKAGAGARLM